jgi:uncharacterized protein
MDADIVLAEVVDERPKSWGFWATVGFSLLVIGVFLFVQTAVVGVYAMLMVGGNPAAFTPRFVENLQTDGLLLSLASWLSLPPVLVLMVLLVKLRRGWSPWDYLALRGFSWKSLFVWLGLIGLLVAIFEGFSSLADQAAHSEFMIRIYKSAGFLPLFWLTLLVEAPVFEEIFFRGFMFRGIEQSRLGGVGAVLITSLAFTGMHVQYRGYELLWVFFLGVLTGVARWKSGSVFLTMTMHAFANLISLVQVHLFFAGQH